MKMKNFLARLRAGRTNPSSPHIAEVSTKAELRVEYALDHFWCDKYGMFFQGWILCLDSPIRRFILTIGEDSEEITQLTSRPDLSQRYPGHDVSTAGFSQFISSRPGEQVFFTVETDKGSHRFPIQLPKATLPILPPWHEIHPPAWAAFIAEANERHLTVLEIGSRIIHGDHSVDCRTVFPHARRYIGLDIHEAPTVDVVGDVHFLSKILGPSSVDAVFSLSVLEHLLYPWIVAKEINRVLTIGGLVFHSTPQAWPIHEAPSDFWRFSEEGLKVLFGPETGFEVIDSCMVNPFYMQPEDRRGLHVLIPLYPGFGNSIILSRKVRDIDPDSILWPINMGTSQERAKSYPRKTSP
jgi:hypothetical protein